MSSVRVFFAEVDGSDDVVRSVISEMAERVNGRAIAPTAAIAPAGETRLLGGGVSAPAAVGRIDNPPQVGNLPHKARKAGRPRKVRQGRSSLGAAPEKPSGETRDAVLAALRKRPMTSGEVIEETGCKPSHVYSILDYMRKQGEVVSKEDERDGQRKNFLK